MGMSRKRRSGVSDEVLFELIKSARVRPNRRRQAPSCLDGIGRQLVWPGRVREKDIAQVQQDNARVTFSPGIVLDAGPGNRMVSPGGKRRGHESLNLLEQDGDLVGGVHRIHIETIVHLSHAEWRMCIG